MGRYLGIDVGGSATRWHLDVGGASRRMGQTTGFSGHLFRPDIREKAERTIAALAQDIGPVDRIVAGITGLTPPSPETDAVKAMLQQAFHTSQISVMSDSRLAYLSAFAPGEGILVYAGTGSVGAHVGQSGDLMLVGGKGVIIDDAGGGYWIAVQALRAILRSEDHAPGRGWGTVLGKALAERLGGHDWGRVREAVYGADRGAIGLFAVAVGQAAELGDPVALQILGQAGHELAELAKMIASRLQRQLPVALAGQVGGLHPAILAGMRSALPDWRVNRVELDCARAAALLASSPSFLESDWAT